jgi:uncharacterized SAM-binding protein YcdF (DUF218 family)
MKQYLRSSFLKASGRWICLAVLTLLTAVGVAWLAAKALIVRADLARADVLLVLGGSSTYLERTHHAAQLFYEGRAPKIILTNDNLQSGWSAEEARNPLFVERASAELKRLGIPPDKIEILRGGVVSTFDEAVQTRQFALERGLKSILIVTSAYQSRRALWTFRRVFQGSETVIGLDPVKPGEQAPLALTWWRHRLGWKLVPGEYGKMIYYWIHY